MAIAFFISKSQLSCVTPSHAVGVFNLEISARDQPLSNDVFSFEFVDASNSLEVKSSLRSNSSFRVPRVYSVEPGHVLSFSNEEVMVTGDFFENVATLGCVFGRLKTTSAIWLSATRLVCVTPKLVPTTVTLKVTNDGDTVSTSSGTLRFHADATVVAVSPSHGPVVGATSVSVYGENFVESLTSLCRFGTVVTPRMRWLSSNEVVCTTPSAPSGRPGAVPIEISSNNRTYTNNRVMYKYDPTPEVAVLHPLAGPASGGTKILFHGRQFVELSTLACRFGQTSVPAWFVSDSLIFCTSPPHPPGAANVEITLNGHDFYATSYSFDYYNSPRIESLWPLLSHGFIGTTVVSLFGTGFRESMELACLFDNIEVQATFVTASSLSCMAPSHPNGLVAVHVTINGIDLAEGVLDFYYFPAPAVRALFPPRGLASGHVVAFVTGSNFVNTTSLKCKFDAVRLRATFVDSSTVACVVPSLETLSRGGRRESFAVSFVDEESVMEGHRQLRSAGREHQFQSTLPRIVAVSVSNNGLDFSDSSVHFEYYAECDPGHYCGGLVSTMCPNGTLCHLNNPMNFTLCAPGTFQPRTGQHKCLPCPVGYYCPDHGLTKPSVCPAGFVCDRIGLRMPTTYCPSGHWCPEGTKTASIDAMLSRNESYNKNKTVLYVRDSETGIVTFSPTRRSWPFLHRQEPATGVFRVEHPPEFAWADENAARAGSFQALQAEQPFPCPIGYWLAPASFQSPFVRTPVFRSSTSASIPQHVTEAFA